MLSSVATSPWITSAGLPAQARMYCWDALARRIVTKSELLNSVSSDDLLRMSLELRWRSKTGTPQRSLLVEAFALVREAARRTRGMSHYPVQLMGGIAMANNQIAEMQTGEGKTLTAVLSAYLRALPGRGCHVITVNDYLASRDAEWMGTIYGALGLSVGCIQADMAPEERRQAYDCDITYGTAKEFGFDFLRDRLGMGTSSAEMSRRARPDLISGDSPVVARGYYFALIDEADSVLIDDARTPLIIGLKQPQPASTVALLRWCDRMARHMESPDDYSFDPESRSATLSEQGCRQILLMEKSRLLNSFRAEQFYERTEQALAARHGFQRDRDYVIQDDGIVIVDESTGRILDGRKWQEGLHQAIEAKENLPLTSNTTSAARITVQRFFRQYQHVGGMTGTALPAARELRFAYGRNVTPIPTHRQCQRIGLPPRIFVSAADKREAIANDIERLQASGRAVLIGTPSVKASDALSTLLIERRIPHQVLNARHHEQEAEIVAEAGQAGRVTVATNMAGRGTDILLDKEVKASGGLHVIATEMHSSVRIDRQLVGRSARQGDPGSFQFYLSLEDELIQQQPQERVQAIRNKLPPNAQGELSGNWLKIFRAAQRDLQKLHRKQRKLMLKREKSQIESMQKMGLDPYLELTD